MTVAPTPGKRPKYLCKYYRDNNFSADVIKNNEIYFSALKYFNDPFENVFQLDKAFNSQQRYKTSDGQKIKTQKQHNKFIDELLRQFKVTYLSKIGVSCFSILPSNYLMWSHYAENHTGFCLIFDTTKDISFFREAEKVTYCETIPLVDIQKENVAEQFIEILYSKSMIWRYEEEYRIVRENVGTYKFNPESLEYMIFGCKMSMETKIKIAKVFKLKYKHATILESFIHPTEYKIIYKDFITKQEFEFEYMIDFEDLGPIT